MSVYEDLSADDEEMLCSHRSVQNGSSMPNEIGGKNGKEARMKYQKERQLRNKRCIVTERRRTVRDRVRKMERATLYEARWNYFLMDGMDVEQVRDIHLIVNERPDHSPSTPAVLNEDFRSYRGKLGKYIVGACFPEEVPEGVETKARGIKRLALLRWKELRSQTAVVDKAPRQKANALQENDRQLQIEKQRSARNYKRHRRMQRLQKRNRGMKAILAELAQSISSDEDLRALAKKA